MYNAEAQAYALLSSSSIINNGTQVLWAYANMSATAGTQNTGQIVGYSNGSAAPYPTNYTGPNQTRT